MNDKKYDLIALAEVIHGTVNVYKKFIGEELMPQWSRLKQEEKDNLIAVVSRSINHMSELVPETNHMAWLFDKMQQGWMFGPDKDVDAKVSPWIVPYNRLPDEQKVKNALFVAVVKYLSEYFIKTN